MSVCVMGRGVAGVGVTVVLIGISTSTLQYSVMCLNFLRCGCCGYTDVYWVYEHTIVMVDVDKVQSFRQ